MLERRRHRRRRVCLEGRLSSGLTGAVEGVQIRNMTAMGAEVVMPAARLDSTSVELFVPKDGKLHRAEIVWRRMERFGLKFADPFPLPARNEAPLVEPVTADLVATPAKRRLLSILSRGCDRPAA